MKLDKIIINMSNTTHEYYTAMHEKLSGFLNIVLGTVLPALGPGTGLVP